MATSSSSPIQEEPIDDRMVQITVVVDGGLGFAILVRCGYMPLSPSKSGELIKCTLDGESRNLIAYTVLLDALEIADKEGYQCVEMLTNIPYIIKHIFVQSKHRSALQIAHSKVSILLERFKKYSIRQITNKSASILHVSAMQVQLEQTKDAVNDAANDASSYDVVVDDLIDLISDYAGGFVRDDAHLIDTTHKPSYTSSMESTNTVSSQSSTYHDDDVYTVLKLDVPKDSLIEVSKDSLIELPKDSLIEASKDDSIGVLKDSLIEVSKDDSIEVSKDNHADASTDDITDATFENVPVYDPLNLFGQTRIVTILHVVKGFSINVAMTIDGRTQMIAVNYDPEELTVDLSIGKRVTVVFTGMEVITCRPCVRVIND